MANNTQNGPVKNETDMKENLESLLEKCPEMMKTLDEGTATLMGSLDMTLTALEMLVQQLEVNLRSNVPNSNESTQNTTACKEISIQLIKMMKGILLHQQKSTVESLSKFLHFIADNLKDHKIGLSSIPESLMIDIYKNKSNMSKSVLHEKHALEYLMKENVELRDKIAELKHYIDLLDEKEQTFLKEEELQNSKIRMSESTKLSVENENTKMKSEIEEMKNQHGLVRLKHEEENEKMKDLQAEHLRSTAKLEEEYKSLQVRMNSIQMEIKDEADQKEEQLQKSKSEIIEKEDQIKKLKSDLKETEQENLNILKIKSKIESEKETIEIRCKELTKEQIKATQSLNDFQAVVEEKEITIHTNTKEIQKLQQMLGDTETSIQNLRTQLEEEMSTNAKLQSNIQDLVCQLDEVKNKNDTLSVEIKDTHLACNMEIQKKEKYVADLLSRAEKEEKAHLELKRENYKIRQDLSSVKQSKEEEVKRLEVERGYLQTEKEHAEKELNHLREQAHIYEDEVQERDDRIADISTQIKAAKMKNFHLEEKVENLSKVLVEVEKELNFLKSKRVLQVQLYSQNRTSLTSIVEQELTVLLKSKMESENLELEFVQCGKASDVQSDIPVLLLCITVSRIGTDVANTMHGLTLNQKVAILIFHHKDEHALPNQASERVLTGQQIKTLGGVFDMAFLSGKGIYNCEMNDNNVISLINFVNREGVRRFKIHQ